MSDGGPNPGPHIGTHWVSYRRRTPCFVYSTIDGVIHFVAVEDTESTWTQPRDVFLAKHEPAPPYQSKDPCAKCGAVMTLTWAEHRFRRLRCACGRISDEMAIGGLSEWADQMENKPGELDE